jgi:hypothetical protein
MCSLKPRRSVSRRRSVCRLAIVTAVFALTFASAAQAQTYSVLHSFTGAGDGSHPAGLAIDHGGNL